MIPYTATERKMMSFAIWCVDTFGTTTGITNYNTVCADYCTTKCLTLAELQALANEL